MGADGRPAEGRETKSLTLTAWLNLAGEGNVFARLFRQLIGDLVLKDERREMEFESAK